MPPLPKINSLHLVFIAVHHLRGVWWPRASVGGFCPAAHWNTLVGSCLCRARALLGEWSLLPKCHQALFPPLATVSGPGCFSCHPDALRSPMSWQLGFDEIILINIFKNKQEYWCHSVVLWEGQKVKVGCVSYSLGAQSKLSPRCPPGTMPHCAVTASHCVLSSASGACMVTAIPQPCRVINPIGLDGETDPKAEASPRQRVRP